MSKEVFGYYQEIPEELRSLFQILCQDIASLSAKWHLYLDLFTDVDILNKTAPGAFQMIEESLRTDMTISTCRLRDPAARGMFRYLSFKTLERQARHIQGLRELLNNFRIISRPISYYRHKRIAHNDPATILEPRENPLPSITPKTINDSLEAGAKILNHLLQFYNGPTIDFERVIVFGSGKKLIKWLKRAWRHYEEEQKALTKGK